MTRSEPARAAARRTRTAAPPSAAVPTTGVTIYGCTDREAALFRELAPPLGVVPTLTDAPVSETNVGLTFGNRCISVSHRTPVTTPTLRALARAGVRYISTRSIGCDHVDVAYAHRIGITVENVTYSPAGVADYTLLLMLMLARNVKCIVQRAEAHDYRLGEPPGKELRDLTVGVIGTGRIGAAVIARLQGFGCRTVAHDIRPDASVDRVPLDELLQLSDIVTLHTPLTADTHHLLDRRRIAQMRPGAFVVNTGRGSLIDTEALVAALEDARLGGAALDVLEGEQGIFHADRRGGRVESELLLRLQQLPNVLVSPHTAYYTDHALRDIVAGSLRSCVSFEGGAAWTG